MLARKEGGDVDAERQRQLVQVRERDVLLAALEGTDICPMDTGKLTELFLAHPQLGSQSAQAFSELFFPQLSLTGTAAASWPVPLSTSGHRWLTLKIGCACDDTQ